MPRTVEDQERVVYKERVSGKNERVSEEPERVLSKTEARQGATPHVTRYILPISTALAVAALVIAYFVMY